jgi:hypothetical protein
LVPQAGVVESALLLITDDLVSLVKGLEKLGVASLFRVVCETELAESTADGGRFGVLVGRERGREGGSGGRGEDGRQKRARTSDKLLVQRQISKACRSVHAFGIKWEEMHTHTQRMNAPPIIRRTRARTHLRDPQYVIAILLATENVVIILQGLQALEKRQEEEA